MDADDIKLAFDQVAALAGDRALSVEKLTARGRRVRYQVRGLAVVTVAALTAATTWVALELRDSSPLARSPADTSSEPWADELAAYQNAADYEVLLPDLEPGETWERIIHHSSSPQMTQGDLWLRTDMGVVHIWESDVPPALLGDADPVGRGEPEVIGGMTWWRIERERPGGPWLSLATRTPEGVGVDVDGPPDAVRSVIDRLLVG